MDSSKFALFVAFLLLFFYEPQSKHAKLMKSKLGITPDYLRMK